MTRTTNSCLSRETKSAKYVPSDEFETLVVEMHSTRPAADKKPADKKPLAVVENRN
jgi:hypothetical protein